MPGAKDPNDLAEPLGSAVRTLIAESKGRVYLVSGHRSGAQQIELRKAHCGTSHEAIYDWPASRCHPPTARPGSSKHETGEAADLGGDLGFVRQRANVLGIHASVAGEPWHWEATGPTTAPAPGGSGVLNIGMADSANLLGGGAPSSALGGIGDALGSMTKAVDVLTDPHTWLRYFTITGGIALAAAGIYLLTQDVGK